MLQKAKYYFINLDLPRAIDNMRYRFRAIPLIYGIRCRATGKMYIGSTFSPENRFYKHLVAGDRSCPELQADIAKYGLKSITVHIFELVEWPKGLMFEDRESHLREVEQRYISKWPKSKRYNTRNSKAS